MSVIEGIHLQLVCSYREPGRYVEVNGNRSSLAPSSVECPYCYVPMGRVVTGRPLARIALMTGEHECIAQLAPETHTQFYCGGCGQCFTLPEGPRMTETSC